MNKKTIIVSIIITITLLSGILLLIKEQKNETINIGIMPVAESLQFFVAYEREFFKEVGLEIKPFTMAGGTIIAPAVVQGDIDIGWTNTVSMALVHEKGIDFRFIEPGTFHDKESEGILELVVLKDSKIKTIEDLKDKKIAINTLSNILELSFRKLAEKHKLKTSYELVEVPFPQMEPALKSGQVDAAILIEPFVTKAKNSENIRVLSDNLFGEISEKFMIAGWFSTDKWAAKHPKELDKFRKAIKKATAFIKQYPDEARTIASKYTKTSNEVAKKMIMPSFKDSFSKEDIQVVIDECAAEGFIIKPFPADEVIAAK